MSKRKATYGRSDRGGSQSRKRKASARKAIESRWSGASMPLGEVTNTHTLSGSRIMDMDSLASGLREVSSHSAQCGGMCVIDGETMHAGLAAVLSVKCIKCGSAFRIASSKQVKTSDGHKRWMVNVAAVLARRLLAEVQHRSCVL